MHSLLTLAGIVWSLPTTLIGLTVGGLGLLTRGRVQRKGRVLEFYGGFVTWSLSKMPIRPMAMTLGHVIIGLNENALEICRDHEMVHVRQCERWGPFFLPAYLLSSAVIWARRGDAYLDNPFEKQAYALSDPCHRLPPNTLQGFRPQTMPTDPTQPLSLADVQTAIAKMYAHKDSARGVEGTFMWLMEEVGELSAALREHDTPALAAEFADVLAWLATLANVSGIDLDRAFQEKYGQGCPGCRQSPCICQAKP